MYGSLLTCVLPCLSAISSSFYMYVGLCPYTCIPYICRSKYRSFFDICGALLHRHFKLFSYICRSLSTHMYMYINIQVSFVICISIYRSHLTCTASYFCTTFTSFCTNCVPHRRQVLYSIYVCLSIYRSLLTCIPYIYVYQYIGLF